MHESVYGWAVLGAVMAWTPCLVSAQDNQPSLDDLLNLPGQTQPGDQPESRDDADESPEVQLDPEVEKLLTAEQAVDLFRQIVRDMDNAADKLDVHRDAGLDTQRLQEEILAKLDQVIASARQQQQGGGGGGGGGGQQQARQQDRGAGEAAQQQQQQGVGQGNQGQQNAGENSGDFSPGDVSAHNEGENALHENKVEWGNLPPRLRDELQQGFSERFSPIYRDLTEAYYKRLAEEGK